MSEDSIQKLSNKIDEIALHASEAVSAAKGSATIALQASVANVKANEKLEAKLDAYITVFDNYIKRTEPVIKMGENAQGASKVILYLTGAVITIGGAWEILRNLFKK